MKQSLMHVAILVADYDEAIAFYTKKLRFELVEDKKLSDHKRWVLVRPENGDGCSLLLAKATGESQQKAIGNQSGGRVFLFLSTDNFEEAFQNLISNKVEIVREPFVESFGRVAVFRDLYGNLWDLIEPAQN